MIIPTSCCLDDCLRLPFLRPDAEADVSGEELPAYVFSKCVVPPEVCLSLLTCPYMKGTVAQKDWQVRSSYGILVTVVDVLFSAVESVRSKATHKRQIVESDDEGSSDEQLYVSLLRMST